MARTVAAAPFGTTFLRDPERLHQPSTAWGDVPWGDDDYRLDLAGGPYRLDGLVGGQLAALTDRFGPGSGSDGAVSEPSPDPVTLRILRLDASETRRPTLGGWSYTFDRAPSPDTVLLAGLGFAARLTLDTVGAPTRVDLWTPHDAGDDFGCLAANVLRTVVAYRLLAGGGLLLHSAGIVRGGLEGTVVDLFLGHSGAGKSTLSKRALATGRRVLSDDMNAVAVGAGGTLEVEKLPFTGELGRVAGPRERLPLGRLCKLAKGPTALRPLSRGRALGFLLTCAPFVNDDPHRADRLLQVLETLTAHHPVHELHVALDEEPWPALAAVDTADHLDTPPATL